MRALKPDSDEDEFDEALLAAGRSETPDFYDAPADDEGSTQRGKEDDDDSWQNPS